MCDEFTVEIYNYNVHNREKKKQMPNIQLGKLRKNTRSHLYKLESRLKTNTGINELENKINDSEDNKVNNWFFKRLITDKI